MPIDTPLNPVSFAAGELTSAKNLDLVVANGGTPFATTPVDGSVLVYLGNGNGTFQSPKTLSAPAFPEAVAIADVNDDGHPDIVVLSEFSGQSFESRVWVFLGDGAGNFGTGIETSLDEYANGLEVGNLNGDSFPDLALASCCGFANTEVWAGNRNGTFTGPTELPVEISSSFPILADINGDNKLDLLVATGDAIETLLTSRAKAFRCQSRPELCSRRRRRRRRRPGPERERLRPRPPAPRLRPRPQQRRQP